MLKTQYTDAHVAAWMVCFMLESRALRGLPRGWARKLARAVGNDSSAMWFYLLWRECELLRAEASEV